MKLAEALLIRGDLQNKIYEMRNRLSNNAIVQEGEQTAENPEELLKQTDSLFSQLEELVTKINLTNALIEKDGKTMTELLAKRDCLKQKISMYRDFLSEASMTGKRARGSEIKVISAVSVAELQKEIDKKAKELRSLEIEIQELNWTNDLKD